MYRTATEVAYTYDALGQLIRVNDPNDPTAGTSGTTWVYSYDRGGNILSKSYYIYTTGTPGTAIDTIAYSYTDSNWKDKLTAYDGQTITYDAIGNPLNDGTWTYTWEKGRQLKQMSKAGMTVEFKYDHNGLRTQKKVTSGGEVTTTEYTLHGKLITHLTRGSDKLHFFYDGLGQPAMVEFNGTLYSYVHNLQSDIVGIVDSYGNLVVEYKYNAWGKPTLVRTLTTEYETLAELNPFRYRGYVWDKETGLYYLRSRYYSPERERFLNADRFVSDQWSVLGKNSFVYCFNCPTMLEESTGAWPTWLKVVTAAVVVVAVTAVCVATAGAAAAALVGTHGVLTATGAVAVGAVKTATAVGGLVAGGSQIVVDAMDGDDNFDICSVAIETISGCGYGMIGGLTGGSSPISVGKWIGAIGRAVNGAVTALARGINNGDSFGDIVKDMATGAGIPMLFGAFGNYCKKIGEVIGIGGGAGSVSIPKFLRPLVDKLQPVIDLAKKVGDYIVDLAKDSSVKTLVIKVAGPIWDAIR